jgi:crossover junction endodeoxyribonuclease RuvC
MGVVRVVLGIDPGSIRTGLGVVEAEGNRLRCTLMQVVEAGERGPLEERLVRVHEGVAAALRESGARAVAVEGVFVKASVRAALQLGHARGVALLAAAQAGAAVFEYPPALVKRAVTGKGSAEKTQVQFMVRALLHLDPAQKLLPDAADALAVAICHLLKGDGGRA